MTPRKTRRAIALVASHFVVAHLITAQAVARAQASNNSVASGSIAASRAPAETDRASPQQFILSSADTHHAAIPVTPRVNRDGTLDVHVHLKGSATAVPAGVWAVDPGTLVITVTEGGFSQAYAKPFSDPELLTRMLDELLNVARQRSDIPDNATVGRLTIASFSAGYAAVRELLKHDRWHDQIDGLLFLDSIYAGYVSDSDRRPLPEQMQGFIRFARQATTGQKRMIVIHNRLMPGSYASTSETADAILNALALSAEPHQETLADQLITYRRAERSGFQLIGTQGDDGAEHGRILAHARLWLPTLFNAPPLAPDADPSADSGPAPTHK